MHGRTENAIKNYFYSTIRRIQSSKAYDFVADIINSVIYNPDRFDNDEQFAEYYEFEKQNHLGCRIILFLRDLEVK